MELQEIGEEVLRRGPCRILVTPNEALSPTRARRQGMNADIIFIRDDGWSLGAPACLEKSAFHLWKGYWTGFIRMPGTQVIPIEEYGVPQ